MPVFLWSSVTFGPMSTPANGVVRPVWAEAWERPWFRRACLGALLLLIALAQVLPAFFGYIQEKPGGYPWDPLVPVIGPLDLSVPIFSVLYLSIVVVVVSVVHDPYRLLRGLFAYAFLLILRMVSMSLVTLEPPPDAVALIDPITGPFYPGDAPFLKDLFFSGHTATLALMALLARRNALRALAWCATAIVGVLVIAQHVHWTVDVVAAPFAAWAAWWGAGRWTFTITPRPLRAGS